MELHPLGEYTLLINSVTKEISRAGNKMYVIRLVDTIQHYLPIKEYIVYFEDNGHKSFYPRDEEKVKALLTACNVDAIEKLAGHHINALIKHDKFRGRKVEKYYTK